MLCEPFFERTKTVIRLGFPIQRVVVVLALLTFFLSAGAGCSRQSSQKRGVRPRTLRDVPAGRLAYQFTADSEAPPNADKANASNELVPAIQQDFDTRRPEDALLRTVTSPDRQRVLVVYATGGDEPNEFRLDVYGIAGDFKRHVTPAGIAVVFASVAAWSPDGNFISFIAYKSTTPTPTPTPIEEMMPDALPEVPSLTPSPLPTIGPTVPIFSTEQVYICNRDGFDLKPLTTRVGLIYFYLAWAPDSHALVSLACRESEWRDRPLLPVGRPRLVGLDGSERLLDDDLTDVLPIWSPDASKVATALDTEVRIYDTLTDSPTQAAIALRDALYEASRAYDQKEAAKNKNPNAGGATDTPEKTSSAPISFNPIVTLEWPKPETLYVQTGYVRNFENEQRRTWMRWHVLRLSAQAALLN
jgi:dipeptidyl aminopeptidase/acylaminoacyl peptidase